MKVVVLGAGVIGVTTAYYLARHHGNRSRAAQSLGLTLPVNQFQHP